MLIMVLANYFTYKLVLTASVIVNRTTRAPSTSTRTPWRSDCTSWRSRDMSTPTRPSTTSYVDPAAAKELNRRRRRLPAPLKTSINVSTTTNGANLTKKIISPKMRANISSSLPGNCANLSSEVTKKIRRHSRRTLCVVGMLLRGGGRGGDIRIGI